MLQQFWDLFRANAHRNRWPSCSGICRHAILIETVGRGSVVRTEWKSTAGPLSQSWPNPRTPLPDSCPPVRFIYLYILSSITIQNCVFLFLSPLRFSTRVRVQIHSVHSTATSGLRSVPEEVQQHIGLFSERLLSGGWSQTLSATEAIAARTIHWICNGNQHIIIIHSINKTNIMKLNYLCATI